MKLSPIQNNIVDLKIKMIAALSEGSYKNFKKARTDYASYAVKHFEEAKQTPYLKYTAPLFSFASIKMAYIAIRDMFRTKTHDEKEFARMTREDKIKSDYLKSYNYNKNQ